MLIFSLRDLMQNQIYMLLQRSIFWTKLNQFYMLYTFMLHAKNTSFATLFFVLCLNPTSLLQALQEIQYNQKICIIAFAVYQYLNYHFCNTYLLHRFIIYVTNDTNLFMIIMFKICIIFHNISNSQIRIIRHFLIQKLDKQSRLMNVIVFISKF